MVIHDPIEVLDGNIWTTLTYPGQKHNQYFELQKMNDSTVKEKSHRVVTKTLPRIAIAHGSSEFEVIEDWQTLSMILFPKIQENPIIDKLAALMKTVKAKLVNSFMFESTWEDLPTGLPSPGKTTSQSSIELLAKKVKSCSPNFFG